MTRAFFAVTICALALSACNAEDPNSINGQPGNGRGSAGDPNDPNAEPGGGSGNGDGTGANPGDPASPTAGACEALPHVGFAGTDFAADRKPGEAGLNRRRVKPYSALASEFRRALGQVPADLATNRAAFGEAPARWYSEPTEGAVSLYTTYTLAFTACYDTMTGANFSQAPTAATATTECAAMQRKFWQRTASPDETKACADLAVGSTTEPLARRRWAHACASILTSSGFTTY